MTKHLIYFCFLGFLLSCNTIKEPIYEEINNVKLQELSKDNIIITADAIFENPNRVALNFTHSDIQVYLDNKPAAKVTSTPFKVAARDTFRIPLKIHVPHEEVFKNGGDWLQKGLNLINNKPIEIAYKGTIYFKILGKELKYKVNEVEQLKLR